MIKTLKKNRNIQYSSTNTRLKLKLWNGSVGEKRPCYYTKEMLSFDEATVDHKIPKSRGGNDDLENLCISSEEANRRKGDLTAREFFFLNSPLGFLFYIFFWQKLKYEKFKKQVRHHVDNSVNASVEKNVVPFKEMLDEKIAVFDKMKKELEQTSLERDRYKEHALSLVQRFYILEDHLKIRIVGKEYRKFTRKELNTMNTTEAIRTRSIFEIEKSVADIEDRSTPNYHG